MPRPWPSTAVAALFGAGLLIAGACNKSDQGAPKADSPNASVAGTEANTHARTRANKAASAEASADAGTGLARALVSVASTSASEAEPCERTCGRLSDCLRESDDFRASEAGGLELECLSLCVHAPDDSPARASFLACEQRDDCGAVRSCAADGWTELAEVSHGPAIEGITAAAGDPCKAGCRWMYSCLISGAPPGEAYLDPQFEEQMITCENSCDSLDPADRETFVYLAECLPNHCGFGQGDECWNYNY
ncbi:hypothetical protein ENSA5_10170 [Enhygromyxa salina]|uniref:Lipoprotein n=1 Tax=Enhygromyxa salina TaxID=215803 RepID=A0A2S9YGF6_9BACT|nr:hypothetical protein [Enhygromyxa salina]PRQ04179.1 hypothetical protein ENSA5_10170 [Enhygromyxa salina]